jgi:hypothetical protein
MGLEEQQMVRSFPRELTVPDEDVIRREPVAAGLGDRVRGRVREVFCGLHGHDSYLQFQHDRMFLKCVSCGHESPGWELNEAPPVSVPYAERGRPLARQPLIDERRIA